MSFLQSVIQLSKIFGNNIIGCTYCVNYLFYVKKRHYIPNVVVHIPARGVEDRTKRPL